MLKAILKAIIDGQAWLYANQLRLQAKFDGGDHIVITEDQMEAWQDEWKTETDRIIRELGDNDNVDEA